MRSALLVLLAACAPVDPPPATPVPAAAHLALVPDPGPPPLEAPPLSTVWQRVGGRWQAVDRVQAIAPGDRARVDAQGRLVIGGIVVAEHVLPDVTVGADGTIYFSRADLPPATDVWRVPPGGAPEAVTQDGQSDRPFPLPDGRLLWVSGAGGMAGFVVDGQRLTNRRGEAFVPVPAFADRTKWVDGRVIYDAGERLWWLDPTTGEAGAQ